MNEITLNALEMFNLSGRVALVTGAGSGIGQRIAVGLAQCGTDVALPDRWTDDGLDQTFEFIVEGGQKMISISADVID